MKNDETTLIIICGAIVGLGIVKLNDIIKKITTNKKLKLENEKLKEKIFDLEMRMEALNQEIEA